MVQISTLSLLTPKTLKLNHSSYPNSTTPAAPSARRRVAAGWDRRLKAAHVMYSLPRPLNGSPNLHCL